MTLKHNDNFAAWRRQIALQRPRSYHKLKQNRKLAELTGVVLGDGYIGQHDRTQVLRISCNSENQGFIDRYSNLVEEVFDKKPAVRKRKLSNCVDIVIYQNRIAERLGLKTGAKTHRLYTLPTWIKSKRNYKLSFLRGLYETDGCHATHKATYTYKFIFSNVNQSLLDIVFMILCEFGFHPVKTKVNVQLSRKAEVNVAVELLKFRKYT